MGEFVITQLTAICEAWCWDHIHKLEMQQLWTILLKSDAPESNNSFLLFAKYEIGEHTNNTYVYTITMVNAIHKTPQRAI